MKRNTLLLFAALLFGFIYSNAQTVDEIASKYIAAMGGKEKLATLKTVRMAGSTSSPAGDIPVTVTKSHMTGMRTDFEYNGEGYYQLANTKSGKIFQPGMGEAIEMDGETFRSFSNQMDIQGALFNYKEKGTTIELVGSEVVEGSDAYNLKATFKNGRVSNIFIDKKTNRVVKTASKAIMQGSEKNVESTYTDYKQNGDGYWFPYTVTSNLRGPIVFTKIETNLVVDEKIYAQ